MYGATMKAVEGQPIVGSYIIPWGSERGRQADGGMGDTGRVEELLRTEGDAADGQVHRPTEVLYGRRREYMTVGDEQGPT